MEKKKRIQLSDHFTYKRLLRFVISPILMMICTSLYSIVDGFFVSNFVGKTPFAAVNLIMPIAMGVAAIGFMIGTGGSAIVSKTLGEGKPDKANEYFSLLIYTAIGISVTLSILGFIFIKPISVMLGVSGELLENCIVYGRILFVSMPAFILMNIFQNFFIAAEKPSLSLKVSLLAGITNVILDFIFIVVLKWGIAGAAWATAAGEFLGGVIPMIYFLRKNDSLLQLTKTTFNGRILLKAFTNGSSEMVTNLSLSIVGVLYNFQLMRLAGEDGVAAYGIIMYVNFIFMAIFFGYSIGTGPIVAYQYGAGNHDELKNVFRKSIKLVISTGIVLTLLAEILNVPLIKIFASYDQDMFNMTSHGFRIYAIAFLVIGVNVWGSAFFTALNNGVVSAAISFLRTLIFQVTAILLLPAVFGIDGVWFAVVAAEMLALLVTTTFLIKNKDKYQYS